jgi:hypothetical protein
MAVQIQLRNDTAANWTSANPTLAAGEVGLETNTGKLKIGNGTTAWNSLAYFEPSTLDGLSDVTITSASTGQVVQFNGTAWVNSDVAISEVTGLQTALDGKQAVISGVSNTEIGYLDGVTSAIQTQLDGKVDEVNGAVTTASTSATVVRNITLSTSTPSGGMDGDVWLQYTA